MNGYSVVDITILRIKKMEISEIPEISEISQIPIDVFIEIIYYVNDDKSFLGCLLLSKYFYNRISIKESNYFIFRNKYGAMLSRPREVWCHIRSKIDVLNYLKQDSLLNFACNMDPCSYLNPDLTIDQFKSLQHERSISKFSSMKLLEMNIWAKGDQTQFLAFNYENDPMFLNINSTDAIYNDMRIHSEEIESNITHNIKIHMVCSNGKILFKIKSGDSNIDIDVIDCSEILCLEYKSEYMISFILHENKNLTIKVDNQLLCDIKYKEPYFYHLICNDTNCNNFKITKLEIQI